MITKKVAGQSLFEVVVAVGIASVVLIAIVSLSTVSLKSSISNKNNTLATKYAQDGMEWIREQRDKDWENVTDHVTGGSYDCLGVSGAQNRPDFVCPGTVATIFNRTYQISYYDDDIYTVKVKVEWNEGGKLQVVETVNQLSNWRDRGTQL